jgi:hypothetical protein
MMQQNEISSIRIPAAKRAEGHWGSNHKVAKCFTKFRICMDCDVVIAQNTDTHVCFKKSELEQGKSLKV